MTLEQLRVFIAVAERLHVTRASEALNITQSAASAAIQSLEGRLGAPLFHRLGRRIELTEAGRVLLPEARAILSRVSDAEQAVAELESLLRGRLRLWASQTIAGYWLPPRMHRFSVAHPRVELELHIGNSETVSRAVVDGEGDIGFVEGDVAEPLLAAVPVGIDRLVLVTAGLRVDAKRFKPANLLGLRWVLRERGSGTRQIFENALRKYGVDPTELDVAMELPSNEAVCSAVEAGAGATVISMLVVVQKLAAGKLIELPVLFPERQFLALRHGDRHRSRAENVFLDMMRSERGHKVQSNAG
jgi:DNA-binding transcriptional LysR family regulator